jgi:hypothetical protein
MAREAINDDIIYFSMDSLPCHGGYLLRYQYWDLDFLGELSRDCRRYVLSWTL